MTADPLGAALSVLDGGAVDPGGVLELRPGRLLVWHPDAVAAIFLADRWMRHGGSRTLGPLLGPRSLLWADGARHAGYRRVLAPALHGRGLTTRLPVVAETVRAAVDALVPGALVRLTRWTGAVTLRVVGRLVFGHGGPADDALLARFARRIDRALGAPSRCRDPRAHRAETWTALDRALLRRARAAVTEAPDSLAARLATLGPPDDAELRDQVVSLLFAGHETTASATAWTLCWLDRDQRLRRDVLDELRGTSDDGADPARVPLLHAVVQESLRLTPPALVAGKRILRAGGELLGRPLPAGTVLTPCVYLAHRHPGGLADPGRFDPTRFLGARVPAGHYLPFGGGVRRCLGRELAMTEIRVIVAAVLRRAGLRCVNPEVVVPHRRGPVLAPSPAVTMRVAP
ncbi:cytochrome P450 [Gandjariella thermophila]|uniref:Cytochrome P450 n=1 Tax=Gandjariella thermophila TaxID=1931992 RepID=A0A4D4J4Z2_9PSEU|nr:cytochrome P450 [Gandjariella thermophila]GDY31591.1 cytochrome P450 [Gandjariella thermophila]